eukprot:Blabericola_migrator_1__5087@NODE_2632_length_2513_cov_28_673753_g1651_i0_p2_GENE_NODE_2632_length_2513_cov_28_673753_g1651_i0NODE_2632_length_2513_cov_28_673753_g1651_i0_p2_ORF_typecomplete_len110_score0_57Peptidase_S8/PF00082_22/1_1e14_NODE_2632_length_2513_cov_28_673753_g1651_i020702399
MGANIISNSWGGGPESSILRRAIERANEKGVLFVISAGNSGKDLDATPVYPASYKLPNTITVGALDQVSLSHIRESSIRLAEWRSQLLELWPPLGGYCGARECHFVNHS